MDKPTEDTVFTFGYKADNLSVEKNDGELLFVDSEGNTVYYLPELYMYDSAGNVSYDVHYIINGSTFTVYASEKWINSEDRVFPVYIDPSLYTQYSNVTTYTATSNDLTNILTNQYTLFLGARSDYGNYYHRIKFNTLPTLPSSSTVCKAYLYLTTNGHAGTGNINVYAQQALSDWTSQFLGTPNNNKILDYAKLNVSNPDSLISLDITEAAINWYATGSNTDVVLYTDPINASPYRNVSVDGKSSTTGPILIVNYRNIIGVESYRSTVSHSAGRAGNASVTLYTGIMTFVHNDVADERYSVYHVYNSKYCDRYFSEDTVFHTKDYTNMKVGLGWRLNCQETVVSFTATNYNGTTQQYLIYTDSDGTEHYFIKTGTNTYNDEDGLGLTIVKSGNNFTMSDDENNQKLFVNGYLTKITDTNGNITAFCYNGNSYSSSGTSWYPGTSSNKITKIVQKNDGKTQYTIATLTYSSNKLTKITDRYGNETTFSLSSAGQINSITEKDGCVMTYNYSYNRMSEAYDSESKQVLSFNYKLNSGRLNYVAEAAQSSANSTPVTRNIYRYYCEDKNYASIRDFGLDLEDNTADDIKYNFTFDDFGRTISSCAYDSKGNAMSSSSADFFDNSGVNRKNNRIISEGSAGGQTINYVKNSGVESGTQNWMATVDNLSSFTDSSLGNSEKSNYSYLGNNALKIDCSDSNSVQTISQEITLPSDAPQGKYTLSAYVKISSLTLGDGTGVWLEIADNSNNVISEGETLVSNTDTDYDYGWYRLSATTTTDIGGGDTIYTIYLRIRASASSGIILADNVQFEQGEAPSKYNYVDSESFTDVTIQTVAQHNGLQGSVIKLDGSPDTLSECSGTININRWYSKNTKTYVLSGWAYAKAVPTNSERSFQITAKVNYSDESFEYHTAKFNSDLTEGWQYVSVPVVPEHSRIISSIGVYCSYKRQCGFAYFDCLSLTEEPCATYTYNSNGYVDSVNSTNSSQLVYSYNGADLISESVGSDCTYNYTYDSHHNITQATVGSRKENITYDSVGNTTYVKLSDSNDTMYMSTGATYTDDGNNAATITDSLGNVSNYSYLNGHLLSETTPSGVSTGYSYYTSGRQKMAFVSGKICLTRSYSNGLISSLERKGSDDGGTPDDYQTYYFTYDIFGNRLSSAVGAYVLADYSYDSYYNLSSIEYSNGSEVNYTYDNYGRVISRTTDTYIENYFYNNDGYVSKTVITNNITNTLDSTVYYTYDSLGRCIQTVCRNADGSIKEHLKYNYNEKNQLAYFKYTDGNETKVYGYTYNNEGQVVSCCLDNQGYTSTLTYDNLGRVTGRTTTYSNNSAPLYSESISYKNLNSSGKTSTLPASYSYTFSGSSTSSSYTYNTLGYITESKIDNNTVGKYGYDENGQLNYEEVYDNGSAYSYVYIYDTYGNIREVNKYSGVGFGNAQSAYSTGQLLETKNYGYTDTDWLDLLTSYDGHTITYDEIGNPLSYYNGRSYTFGWTNGRSLTSATVGNQNISFKYNSDGTRKSKTVGSETYEYHYAGGKLISITKSNGYKMTFVFDESGRYVGFDEKLSTDGTTTTYIYVYNAQGDII